MSETIHHIGIVARISQEAVFVRITQRSACSGCHAKSMCSASEQKEQIIEIPDHTGQYAVGEEVEVCGQTNLGMEAVVLAFVIPLILVVAGVAGGIYLGCDESVSGLISLLILVPYYGALYLFRDRLKKRFVFTVRKLNS
ncbi:MAG: SoxR reducing system RseC family protein [Parabacteroides sp.]